MNAPALYDDAQLFCSNAQCILHCAPGAPTVRGAGNWAVFPSGLTVGRLLVNTHMLCDFCARGETHSLALLAKP